MSERDIICAMVMTLSRFKMFKRITADMLKRTKYKLF